MPPILTVTDSAAERARALLSGAGVPDGGLRVTVQSVGCASLTALLDLAAGPEAGEVELQDNGVRLFVDPGCVERLPGSTLDHRRTPSGSEFTWSRGAGATACSCAGVTDCSVS